MLCGKLCQRSISKTFQMPTWNQETRQRIISFWNDRGFTLIQLSDNIIVGRRGSFWGNLTSFDMSKLITKLTISVDASNSCTCILDINTSMQVITSWNAAHWQLELDTFESYILNGDMKEQEWTNLRDLSAKSDNRWIIGIIIAIMVPAVVAILQIIIRKIF